MTYDEPPLPVVHGEDRLDHVIVWNEAHLRRTDAIPGILAPFIGRTIEQPSLYLYGEHDRIAGNSPAAVGALESLLPGLRGVVKLEGAGHWLQQERPDEVNEALVKFLGGL